MRMCAEPNQSARLEVLSLCGVHTRVTSARHDPDSRFLQAGDLFHLLLVKVRAMAVVNGDG
jgi:hypothetical protein